MADRPSVPSRFTKPDISQFYNPGYEQQVSPAAPAMAPYPQANPQSYSYLPAQQMLQTGLTNPFSSMIPTPPSGRAPTTSKSGKKKSGSDSSFAFIVFLLIAICCLACALYYVYYKEGFGTNFCIVCCCFLLILLPLAVGESFLLHTISSLGSLTWILALVFLILLSSSSSYMLYNY